MTHVSGLEFINDWCKYSSVSLQESVAGIGIGGTADGQSRKPAEILFPHGTQIQYSDVGMQVAGGMAQLKAGKDWKTMFKERIGDKCKMNNSKWTGFDGIDMKNIAIADGLVTNIGDYANFLLMLLNDGTFQGTQVL